MSDLEFGNLDAGLPFGLHYQQIDSLWMSAGSPTLVGVSTMFDVPSLPPLWQAGWGSYWQWTRRLGLSYLPLFLLGIGLSAVPLQAQAQVQQVVIVQAEAIQSAPVGVVGADDVVEVPVEPVRLRAEVRMDAGCAAMRRERPTNDRQLDALEQASAGIVLSAHSAHATLSEKPATPKTKARKQQDRPGPDAEIADGVFTDEQVKGLVDDWLIPLLVDSLVQERLSERKEV